MSLVTKIKSVGINPISGTEPVTAQNVKTPQIWEGMQAYFSADYGVSGGQFSASHSNPQYQNKYYNLILDSVGREYQKDYVGNVYGGLFRVNLGGGNAGWGVLSTGTFLGKNEIVAATKGLVHYMSGESYASASDKIRQNTLAYSMFLLFRADVGSVGGVIGQSDSLIASNDAAGFRVGFGSGAQAGKIIIQHSASQRMVIDRNVADGQPILIGITCSEDHALNVQVRHGGVYSTHSQQLTAPYNRANGLVIGNCDDVGTGSKRWAVFCKYNRQLTSVEASYVFGKIQQAYPGFN